jgi:hypothetical protein
MLNDREDLHNFSPLTRSEMRLTVPIIGIDKETMSNLQFHKISYHVIGKIWVKLLEIFLIILDALSY